MNSSATGWLRRVERDGPLYMALVRALEAAIRDGELQPGDRLPPQRAVAEALGCDFTTVTRAYAAARARGLLEGAVGRGTFVRSRAVEDEAGLVDLSMNLPPPPDGVSLGGLLRETTSAILARTDAAALMAYHPGAGTLRQRLAGAAWLAPVVGEVEAERVLVCPGAQTALAAIFSTVAARGGAIVVEPLSYPGVRACAAQLGLKLLTCETDGEGPTPDSLERLCREHRPAALYLVPTTQNPMGFTVGAARRRAIAAAARANDLWIVEDDPYARLYDAPPAAIASHAPDRTFHVATLSKCLSPGLRTAFVACPSTPMAEVVAEAMRALALMPAPLMSAVATSWIRDGAADELLAGVRRETRARRALAAELLPAGRSPPEAIHLWLELPPAWSGERLRQAAQAKGLSLVAAEAFAMSAAHPNGVRISLGGPAKRQVLAQALASIAALVGDGPAASARMVV